MTTANENTNQGCCGGHGHHGAHDASIEQRDLGLKDVHAADAQCSCEPGQCECGHRNDHTTCDCASNECECKHEHGHEHDQAAAVHRGVPDHGDCECKQCQDADKEAAREAAKQQDGEGGCGCGCGHGHGGNGEAKDFTDPDTVNEDGTNPAVRTVDKPETYNENARWNEGN